MREPQTYLPTHVSVGQPGRVAPLSRPGITFTKCYRQQKGGDGQWYVFEPVFLSGEPHKKENLKKTQLAQDNSPHVNTLIRAAALVHARGEIRPVGEVPLVQEEIGILLNWMRRRKRLSLENLSKNTGISVEEIFALEAGSLPTVRICQLIEQIASEVGIDAENFLKQIHTT